MKTTVSERSWVSEIQHGSHQIDGIFLSVNLDLDLSDFKIKKKKKMTSRY